MRKLFEKWFVRAGVMIPGLEPWQQSDYEDNMEKAFRKGFNEGKKAAKK